MAVERKDRRTVEAELRVQIVEKGECIAALIEAGHNNRTSHGVSEISEREWAAAVAAAKRRSDEPT